MAAGGWIGVVNFGGGDRRRGSCPDSSRLGSARRPTQSDEALGEEDLQLFQWPLARGVTLVQVLTGLKLPDPESCAEPTEHQSRQGI